MGKKIIKIYFYIYCFLFINFGYSQIDRFNIHNLNLKDGLSHSSVTSIEEDDNGFLWIGTENGLNHFDGYNFKHYYAGKSEKTPLKNHVTQLYSDSFGQIWISYYKSGIQRLDPKLEIFHTYSPLKNDSTSISSDIFLTPSSSNLSLFFEDSDNNLWIGTNTGINRFDRDNDGFELFKYKDSDDTSLDNSITIITEDKFGYLWIGTYDGIIRIDKATGEIKRVFSSKTNPELLQPLKVSDLYFHDDGSLWLGTVNMGFFIIQNPSNGYPLEYVQYNEEFLPAISSELKINKIVKTSTEKLLIGTNLGLFNIAYSNKKLQLKQTSKLLEGDVIQIVEDQKGYIWAVRDHPNEKIFRFEESLNSFKAVNKYGNFNEEIHKVKFIEKGDNDIIYVGSTKGGLYIIDINAIFFKCINTSTSNKFQITNNDVYSIYKDRFNYLWVGTAKELNLINCSTKKTKAFKNIKLVKDGINFNQSKNLESQLIGNIVEDKNDNIWFGSFDYKVALYNRKKEIFTNFHNNPKDSTSFTAWSVRTICNTSIGETYIGGTDGVLSLANGANNTFIHFNKLNEFSDRPIIYNIIEDINGLLWLGTYNGLKSFNPKTKKFTHYFQLKDNNIKIEVRTILEPKIHKKNLLWLGTNTGLASFDKNTKKINYYNLKGESSNFTILGILEDGDGNLWMSTNANGLVKFNPISENVKYFSTNEGIQSNEFNAGSYFKDDEGVLYFGGRNGITYFNPKEIINQTYPAKVVLTNLIINQQSININEIVNGNIILNKSISNTNKLNLSHKEKLISIEFASSNIMNSKSINYRYKLVGYEDRWNQVTSDQRFAIYSNLNTGSYTLLIDCDNGDNNWTKEPTEIKISISPYLWEKTWFRLFAVLIVITIIIFIFQLRTRNLKKQRALLKQEIKKRTLELNEANEKNKKISEKVHELDVMKLRFFANISHEFRTPLTLILNPIEKLIQLKELKNKRIIKENLRVIQSNSKRLYKLINQLLELPKVDSETLKLLVSKNDIISFSKEVVLLFKDYAKSKNVNLKFSSDHTKWFVYFDQDKIEKILYNLISNAINYSNEGKYIEILIQEKQSKESKPILNLIVRDSGKGIAKDKIKYVFDRFYQNDNNANSSKLSLGIGLSLVKSLVTNHKGQITVASEVNKGTEFLINIPVGKESFNSDEIIEISNSERKFKYSKSMISLSEDQMDNIITKEEVTSSKKDVQIIIVEDNKNLNNFLVNELSSDYDVKSAKNGKEGLDLILKYIPNIVISDVMMPVMDGIVLCKRIKSNINISHIPVFLLTAKSDYQDQLEGLGEGADDYIVKPFSINTLKLRIANAINNRRKIIEKFSNETNPLPKGINISSIDKNLLQNIIDYIKNNLDKSITGDLLASEMGLSKSNLYKKLKSLTGFSVNIYIRNIRLNLAAQILKKGKYNISEVAYAVGFNDTKYFSTCFTKYHGESPRSYMVNQSGLK